MQNKLLLSLLGCMVLAGCATSSKYIPYTAQKSPAKSKYYFVTMYPQNPPPAAGSYRVIGKVDVQGYVSDGVTSDILSDRARDIARKKGADAIIHAQTQGLPYTSVYSEPGHFGRYHYHPGRYYSYGDTLLHFSGELIILIPGSTQTNR